MGEKYCPQCNKEVNDSKDRLVQDNCGHKKCRLCLLADESECLQCSHSLKLIENDREKSIDSNIKHENNQTAVIMCNKFCTSNKVSGAKTCSKENDNKLSLEKCEAKTSEVINPNKRKYNSFVLPSHVKQLKVNLFECTACNKTFHTKYYVNNHKYCLDEEKPFQCKKCSKTFASKSQLETHSVVHTDVFAHICAVCKKSFKQKSKLKRHELIHTKAPNFICQTCGKAFKTKEYLKIHSYIHDKEKPFHCTSCNLRFSNSSNLKKHFAKHSKEKKFMCDQCGKRFKLKWSLIVHRKSHVRVRHHQCHECSKAFINDKELQRHLLTHLDVKAYSCSLCEASFRRKDNLERHIKNTHPGKKVATVTKADVKKLIKEKLKSITPSNREPIKEKPNAINVITNVHKPLSVISPTVNAPLKLAFKTKAFKSHYNIHSREYVDSSTSKLQPRTYDAAESVNICKKILAPYSPISTPSPNPLPDAQSTEIYEKILNSAPLDCSQPRPYGIIKFKLPSNYKNILRNDQTSTATLQPLQKSQEVAKISALGSFNSNIRESNANLNTTSVIVNSFNI